MSELEEMRLAYAECARQRNDLLIHRKNDAERIRVLREALRPFAEVDLCTKGFHQNFAMHVLQARAALDQS